MFEVVRKVTRFQGTWEEVIGGFLVIGLQWLLAVTGGEEEVVGLGG
ncbi:MAG: hypothetical protein M3396_11310 [Actinomycetota bacterium]|nr:hypothetical protein [Actinomycetota bacterium]MDQ3575922.1 hypothetical protein [Actinomycetota bacterium]